MQWEPIETAPKDGTRILACGPDLSRNDDYVVVWWEQGGWCYAWHEYDGPMQDSGMTQWTPITPPDNAGAKAPPAESAG